MSATSEKVRWHLAWHVSKPLWSLYRTGLRVGTLHDRIIRWGEKARP